MPFNYSTNNQQTIAATYSTSSATNTEIDFFSIKPGARNAAIYAIRGQGRGAGLTALSGISLNCKLWTTASTGGATITPNPMDSQSQAATAVVRAGATGANSAVLAGSGGGTYRGGFGFGASGPGGWVAANPDAVILQPGSATSSIDMTSISGTASLAFDWFFEHGE